MSHACTPVLVGVVSGFGDMATFKKQPNFPFGAWTIIVHGHRKI